MPRREEPALRSVTPGGAGGVSVLPQGQATRRPSDETLGQTIRRLSGAQKTSKGAPAYSRFVNRKAGRIIAAVAYHCRLTPNAVTLISAAWSFAAIVLLVFGSPTTTLGIAVCACLAIGYAFDSADGQLARLRGGGSPAGEWLDHVVDSGKVCGLHLAVLVSLYRAGTSDRELLIPLVWTWVATVLFFVIILNDQLHRALGTVPATDAPAPVLRSLLVAPTDYGVLLLTFVLLGEHHLFLWVYGLLLVANIAYLAAGLAKWFRELSHLPTTGATA
ncbi:CDP-alcohol phosphatidyltransferase family protein [Allobranchiibius sp. CTAmp26]|uniref:CDP-alcohol phosphatidyltransferase family protein n=1 Tax=Allobranchiibius sp. CTAmp26 TaxID=2815214 RepID=UPI001AA0FC2F|nr:CDP-alcohol phosphatidyltransferase family protein [Allobranchiibius sp. CTAmp26]MBO1756834.1 CDP-alcohol phosphatidyltransferase family protein [Allobranchiibius sp. CTAmp26]